MKKLISAAILAAVAVTPFAQAEDVTLAEGAILVGNPNGMVVGGVSEILEGCAAGGGEAQGIDGIAFEVEVEALGRPAKLVTTGDAAVDANVYWYTSTCGLIDDYTMATDLTADEAGAVPSNAAYGVIDLIIGASADVKLTYEKL